MTQTFAWTTWPIYREGLRPYPHRGEEDHP
jgi:hypothetical protein